MYADSVANFCLCSLFSYLLFFLVFNFCKFHKTIPKVEPLSLRLRFRTKWEIKWPTKWCEPAGASDEPNQTKRYFFFLFFDVFLMFQTNSSTIKICVYVYNMQKRGKRMQRSKRIGLTYIHTVNIVCTGTNCRILISSQQPWPSLIYFIVIIFYEIPFYTHFMWKTNDTELYNSQLILTGPHRVHIVNCELWHMTDWNNKF